MLVCWGVRNLVKLMFQKFGDRVWFAERHDFIDKPFFCGCQQMCLVFATGDY